MHTTTIIRAKAIEADSFGQLVHVDADPAHQQVKRAIAGFLAGYSGRGLRLTSPRRSALVIPQG